MRAIQDRRIAVGRAGRVQRLDLLCDPVCFLLAVRRVMAEDGRAAGQNREQVLFDAVLIFRDQAVAGGEDLRGRAVVFHHHNGLRRGIDLVKVQQIPHVRAAPRVDGLIRVADDEKILVIAAQDLHQLILRRVDILKFIDHDVFQPLLPFEPDVLMRAEDIEGELDQIVVVKREALLFLIEIAVENDILCACGLLIFFLQRVEGQGDHVLVILRPLLELQHLDHVARVGERHVAQRQPALVIDDLQHGVNIAVVEHQKALGIADSVAVLL